MPNPISKIFAIVLLVITIIFVPVYQSYQRQEDLAYQVAKQAVTDFVDNVRMKGYITPQQIEDFQTDLELGSYLFKTEFVHEKKVYTPVYTDPTNPGTFTGEYVVDFDEYHTSQIMDYLFEEPNKVNVDKSKRKYFLSTGDYFSVHVENMTRTTASLMFDSITGNTNSDGIVISIPYGGMVLNEDY